MCAAFVAVSVRGCPAATGPLAGVATGARAVTDGSSDGDEDGDALGLPLGDALGDALGLPLGDALGDALGASVPSTGDPLGDALGDADGDPLGEADGESDGDALGLSDGDADGACVSAALTANVPNAVESLLWSLSVWRTHPMAFHAFPEIPTSTFGLLDASYSSDPGAHFSVAPHTPHPDATLSLR